MHEQKRVFRRLRFRITLICTALTGSVLLAACFLACRAAVSETRRAAQQTFLAQCQTVENFLSADSGIDAQSLLRFAQQNRLAVAVNDGGAQLSFAPGLSQQALASLLDACALKAGFFTVPEPPAAQDSRLQTGGESYRVHLTGQYRSAVRWHNTLVFQQEDLSQLQRLRRRCALIFLGGLLLLAAAAWALSRRMVRPAEAAQQEQLRFFAMASHELKSPLAVISSCVDMLQRGLGSFAEQSRCIRRETDQMARLVDDMLILSGSGSGRWTLQRRRVQPEDVLLSAYEAYAGRMEAQGQTLRLRLPEGSLPAIEADEQRLRQILTILLDNALCHAPSGSEILLCAAQNARQILFQVIDHGTGVPEEEKKYIFNCFYRSIPYNNSYNSGTAPASAPDGRAPGHWGLGLAVAHELARLHSAALTVSDTPGGGATFTLAFPKSGD